MECLKENPTYFYKLYGLNIKSDFYISELSSNEFDTLSDIDIEIIHGTCPDSIDNIKESNYYYTVSNNEAMFKPEDWGKFYITKGNKIIIETIGEPNYEHLKAYLLSRSFGILLYQRNTLALHSSTILFDNAAYAFCGQSGTGKSSLGAALCLEGYKMLSDDLSVITFKDNKPFIQPGFAQHKLCEDTMEYFNISPDNLNKVDHFANKFSIPTDNKFEDKITPISVLIELSLDYKEENDTVIIKEILGEEKLQTIFRNIFAGRLLNDVGLNPIYLKQCLTLAKNIRIFKLTRPKGKFTLKEQIELIKQIRG